MRTYRKHGKTLPYAQVLWFLCQRSGLSQATHQKAAAHLRFAGQKGNVRCAHSSACGYAVLSVERLTCGSPDRKATFAYAHSNSLRSLLSVLPCESPDGSSGKKATFAALTPSPAATLSCSPSESPVALRENRHGLRFCGSRMGLSVVRKPTGVDPLVGSVAEWESIVKPQKRYVHNG